MIIRRVTNLRWTFLRVDSLRDTQWFDFFFASDLLWWINVSSVIIRQPNYPSRLRLKDDKRLFGVLGRMCLWSIVNKHYSFLENNFLIPIWLFKIKGTLSSLICLWFGSIAHSFSDRLTTIFQIDSAIAKSDIFRAFTTLKQSCEILCHHWNWWCSLFQEAYDVFEKWFFS